MRLEEGSAVQVWYASLPGEQQVLMRTHWILYLQGIKDMYLGRTWQRKMNRQYELQRFRQKGHETETPQAFIARRTMWTRMLVVADDGGANEVYHIMEKAPISWGPILILENVVSTMALYSKVVEHELALVNAWRSESARGGVSTEQLVATLKSLGYSPDKARFSLRQAHLSAAEETRDDGEGDVAENAEPEVETEFGNSNDEQVLRQAYATLKDRKRPPPAGGYPFPKDDSVVTKLGKLPPGPCRLCGSEKHWNRECSHYVVYSEGVKRNAKLVSLAEPSAEETMYQSAFSVLLNQTLSKTGPNLEKLGGTLFFEKAVSRVKTPERKTSTATDKETSKRKSSFAGMEEIEDEDERKWKDKPKSEFSLLEEIEEEQSS
jgi:hypothetical protein